MINCYPVCGILITWLNFLIVLLPFFLGFKNNQHPPIPKRSYLIWCAQIHRISYLLLLALFWQKSQIIFWDALYTYCSCPAKGMSVKYWHRKYSWWHRYCVGHPGGSADWPEGTMVHPSAIWPGGKGKKWLLLCPEGRSWGQVQLASSWVQLVQAKEKQFVLACLGQHRQMLLTRYAEKGNL